MPPLLRFTRDLFEGFEHGTPNPCGQPVAETNVPVGEHETAELLSQALEPALFRHPKATRQVHLERAVVAYAFARGRRKTIAFAIGAEGLSVRAPRWTPLAEVDAALKEKSRWILRKLQEMQERQQRQGSARIVWSNGAVVPYLGGAVTVVLDAGQDGLGRRVRLVPAPANGAGAQLLVGLPGHCDGDQIRDAVHAWLMQEARTLFVQRLDHFAALLGVQWKRLRLSSATTRWGSASVDGSIRLNWRLMHFSPAVVDYVVAHELSHLRVMDHSPQFWATVGSVFPDYRAVRGALKGDGVPRR